MKALTQNTKFLIVLLINITLCVIFFFVFLGCFMGTGITGFTMWSIIIGFVFAHLIINLLLLYKLKTWNALYIVLSIFEILIVYIVLNWYW